MARRVVVRDGAGTDSQHSGPRTSTRPKAVEDTTFGRSAPDTHRRNHEDTERTTRPRGAKTITSAMKHSGKRLLRTGGEGPIMNGCASQGHSKAYEAEARQNWFNQNSCTRKVAGVK